MQKMIIYKSDTIVSVAYIDAHTILSRAHGSQFGSITDVFAALRTNATHCPSVPIHVLITNQSRNITRHYILPPGHRII